MWIVEFVLPMWSKTRRNETKTEKIKSRTLWTAMRELIINQLKTIVQWINLFSLCTNKFDAIANWTLGPIDCWVNKKHKKMNKSEKVDKRNGCTLRYVMVLWFIVLLLHISHDSDASPLKINLQNELKTKNYWIHCVQNA